MPDVLSLFTLPVRAAVELIVAAGRRAAPEGPVRRPGGYAERITTLLEPGVPTPSTAALPVAKQRDRAAAATAIGVEHASPTERPHDSF